MQSLQKYTPSEVSLHSSKNDCWLIIHGKVYDVTTFLEDHPGGDDVLLQAAVAGDATQSFDDVGHSSTAASMMEGYLIGSLDGVAGDVLKSKEAGASGAKASLQQRNGAPGSSGGFTDIFLPLLFLGVAFCAWYYLTFINKA